ncbi:GNAT family N-acetyltransferase [Streptomyces sp. NPDC001691]|uniref:GNAT family N-acetyltransferase n=1 Tax=unclassified Streptomyces TaxID=2593676 RepID=UPI000DEB5299|nr:GNAT family N-acetyltransferase [Streptomyces sp. SDr-06]RCH65660.1 N-acetyltransferase [Streptomyces sp. SDr-06]
MAEIRDDRSQGLLTAFEGGEPAGRIVYFTLDGQQAALVAVHTVVEPAYEGRGIAGSLVREFYAMAAREGVPVVPLCPYAAKWAERHPDEAPAAPAGLVEAARARVAADPELW